MRAHGQGLASDVRTNVLTHPGLLWSALAYLNAPAQTHMGLHRQALKLLRACLAALDRHAANANANAERMAALAAQAQGLPPGVFGGVQPLLVQGLFWHAAELGADCLDALIDAWFFLPPAVADRSDLGPFYLVLYAVMHFAAAVAEPLESQRPPELAHLAPDRVAKRLARTLRQRPATAAAFGGLANALGAWAATAALDDAPPPAALAAEHLDAVLAAAAQDLAAFADGKALPNLNGREPAGRCWCCSWWW